MECALCLQPLPPLPQRHAWRAPQRSVPTTSSCCCRAAWLWQTLQLLLLRMPLGLLLLLPQPLALAQPLSQRLLREGGASIPTFPSLLAASTLCVCRDYRDCCDCCCCCCCVACCAHSRFPQPRHPWLQL